MQKHNNYNHHTIGDLFVENLYTRDDDKVTMEIDKWNYIKWHEMWLSEDNTKLLTPQHMLKLNIFTQTKLWFSDIQIYIYQYNFYWNNPHICFINALFVLHKKILVV